MRVDPKARRDGRAQHLHALKRARNHTFFRGLELQQMLLIFRFQYKCQRIHDTEDQADVKTQARRPPFSHVVHLGHGRS
jgi:hypothetical protein